MASASDTLDQSYAVTLGLHVLIWQKHLSEHLFRCLNSNDSHSLCVINHLLLQVTWKQDVVDLFLDKDFHFYLTWSGFSVTFVSLFSFVCSLLCLFFLDLFSLFWRKESNWFVLLMFIITNLTSSQPFDTFCSWSYSSHLLDPFLFVIMNLFYLWKKYMTTNLRLFQFEIWTNFPVQKGLHIK